MFLFKILTGNLTKKQAAWLIMPCAIAMLVGWLVARVFHGSNGDWYYFDFYQISRQGSLVKNPIGAWFFIVGTVLGAWAIALLFLFLFRCLGRRFRWLSFLLLLSGLTGAVGLFLVGITPGGSGQTLGQLHGLGSNLAFGGLFCAAILSLLIATLRIIIKAPWPTPLQTMIILGLFLQIGSMVFFSKSGSVGQWTSFNAILIWLGGLFLIAERSTEEG